MGLAIAKAASQYSSSLIASTNQGPEEEARFAKLISDYRYLFCQDGL
jgi:hypothetical protein